MCLISACVPWWLQVAKLDSHRTAYNDKLEVVTTFLKDTDLPRHLSKRCGTYHT
jgi:hypothetical protein